MKHAFAVAIFLTASLLCGCGTFASKGIANEIGHPYSGIRVDLAWVKCGVEVVGHDAGEFPEMLLSAPLGILIFAAAIIDMPLSFVADTLFLPVDLAVEPQQEAHGPTDCAL